MNKDVLSKTIFIAASAVTVMSIALWDRTTSNIITDTTQVSTIDVPASNSINIEKETSSIIDIDWGTSYDEVKTILTTRGYDIFSEGDNYLNFVTGLQGQLWSARLDFNENKCFYGMSLYLQILISEKSEIYELSENMLTALYNIYEPEAMTDMVNTIKNFQEKLSSYEAKECSIKSFGNDSDVTAILFAGHINPKYKEELEDQYLLMGVDSNELQHIEDNKLTRYGLYLVYVNHNYQPNSDNLENDSEGLSQSFLDDDLSMVGDNDELADNAIVVKDGVEPESIRYYTDEEGRKIIFNIVEYERFVIEPHDDMYVINSETEELEKAKEVINKLKNGEATVENYE